VDFVESYVEILYDFGDIFIRYNLGYQIDSSSIRIEGGGKEVTAIDIELGGYL
jgi:hypothetical protein